MAPTAHQGIGADARQGAPHRQRSTDAPSRPQGADPDGPLSAQGAGADARLLAGVQLPRRSGMIYLKDNPLLREPLEGRARQAPAARPLGREPGAVVRVDAPEPADHQAHDLDVIFMAGPGPRRARACSARPTSKAPTRRSIRTRARTRRGCRSSSSSSPSPAASAATARRRRRARSTKAASSATASRTPTARRSTTPT